MSNVSHSVSVGDVLQLRVPYYSGFSEQGIGRHCSIETGELITIISIEPTKSSYMTYAQKVASSSLKKFMILHKSSVFFVYIVSPIENYDFSSWRVVSSLEEIAS